MNFFNNTLLKEERKKRGITQHDASRIIGVARTTYADYENGKIQPPIDKIHRICEWLDIPLENITSGNVSRNVISNSKITESSKKLYVKRIKAKADIVNEFDDISILVRNMKIKKNEKDLILSLLDYIMQSYIPTSSELELYNTFKDSKND